MDEASGREAASDGRKRTVFPVRQRFFAVGSHGRKRTVFPVRRRLFAVGSHGRKRTVFPAKAYKRFVMRGTAQVVPQFIS
ncbi:MAG: hypothetical protein NC242_09695 [Roseburia sp.]|nr:hypothetical protein [Roseburia sp.]MCM1430121.1 hypothetical protein [Muribaculaceae bacterium]